MASRTRNKCKKLTNGVLLMSSDDEEEEEEEKEETDKILPFIKKPRVTYPSASAPASGGLKFSSLFEELDEDSINDKSTEGKIYDDYGVIKLDSDDSDDEDNDDMGMKEFENLKWTMSARREKREDKKKKNKIEKLNYVNDNNEMNKNILLKSNLENTAISKDVELDLNKLVPDREKREDFNCENLNALFTFDDGNSNISLSQDDVVCLLDQNNKMADATEEIDTPLEMNVILMKHQKRALAWMAKREIRTMTTPRNHPCGGILADEQGLGKTLSALALIYHNRPPPEREVDRGQTLIICPLSMLYQWGDEIHERTADGFRPRVLLHHGAGRATSSKELKRYDIVVSTYSTIQMEYPKLFKGPNNREWQRKKGPLYSLRWFRVILDEAQAIKNRRTDVWAAAFELDAERRWCLTGTPLCNTIDDLYSLFIFLRYLIVESYQQWKTRWKTPMESCRQKVRERIFKQFQTVLGVVLLRRVKSEKIDGKPIVDLPEKNEQVIELEFSSEESAFYRALERRTVIQMSKYVAQGNELSSQYMFFLTLLLRLRQTCGHPSLCDWHSRKVIYTDEEMDAVLSRMDNGNSILEQLPPDVRRRLEKDLLLEEECLLQECPICISEIEVGQGVVTKCGHFFCCSCDERWFVDHDACAVCRTQLNCDSERYPLESVRKEVFVLHRENLREKGLLRDKRVKEEGVAISKKEPSEIKQVEGESNREEIQAADMDFEEIRVARSTDKENTMSLANLNMQTETSPEGSQKENFVSSTKIDAIVSELKAIRDAEEDKCIVFSQWTRMLDLIEIPLEDEGILFERLDGSMQVGERLERITNFKKRKDITCMLISLHSGGTGLNLTVANRVLFADFWWNPALESQAIDRVHRIGQTKPVTVKRFKIVNTVEDRILELQERKRELILGALGTEGMQTLGRKRLTLREIGELFGSVIQNTVDSGDQVLRDAALQVVNSLHANEYLI